MTRVLAVGNAFADRFRATTDDELNKMGLRKGDTAIVDLDVVQKTYNELTGRMDGHTVHLGGSGSNVAKGLALLFELHEKRNTDTVTLLGRVGNDDIGNTICQKIEEMGIVDKLIVSDQPTGLVNCLVNPDDAQRTMQAYLGAANDFCVNDLIVADLQVVDLVHIEGYNVLYGNKDDGYTLEELVDRVGQQNNERRASNSSEVKISLDLAGSFIAESNRERLLEVIEKVDLLFGNLSEYIALFGPEIQNPSNGDLLFKDNFYSRFREDQIIVVTKGAEGCEVKNRGTLKAVHFDAEKVENVKDTTGAGDSYDAGFIYGYLMGLSIEKCVKIATRMASHMISILGTDFSDKHKKIVIEQIKFIAGEGETPRLKENSDSESNSALLMPS